MQTTKNPSREMPEMGSGDARVSSRESFRQQQPGPTPSGSAPPPGTKLVAKLCRHAPGVSPEGYGPSRIALEWAMPSFDVVSELDAHEVTNAVDQANRELSQRFDFKDSGAVFELNGMTVSVKAEVEFQLKQML